MTLPFPPSNGKDAGEDRFTWHILGGNNKHRVGMNANLCVYEESNGGKRAVLFDAGILTGDPKHPEHPVLSDYDTVMPDLGLYLYKKDGTAPVKETPIDAIFLTHSHSDHISALPFLALMGYRLPRLYATPYTAKRLEQEFSNAGLSPEEWPQIFTIAPGHAMEEGPLSVSPFWVSHSTPQSVGYFIESPKANVMLLGDFKFDQSVIWGPAFDETYFKKLAARGVDMLVMDSTGADRDVTPVTEHDMRESLRDLMQKYPDKRFVVAVMSGFEENVASVAKVCGENNRTVWAAGWSHEQALDALKQTGMTMEETIRSKVDMRILSSAKSAAELAAASPAASAVIVTGAQGRSSAALTKAVDGQNPTLSLDPKKDVIIFCAPSIPGQEAYRQKLLFNLRAKGYTVITRDDAPLYTHAHARLCEIQDIARMTQAKTVLPAHGDRHLRNVCGEEMKKIGQNVLQADNGAIIDVSSSGCRDVAADRDTNPPLLGLKTMQGQSWADRNYLLTKTPLRDDPAQPSKPANSNDRKRPKIFDVGPK